MFLPALIPVLSLPLNNCFNFIPHTTLCLFASNNSHSCCIQSKIKTRSSPVPLTQHLYCFNRSLYFSPFRGRIKQDAVTHKHRKNISGNTSDKSWRFQSSSLSSSSSCNTSSSRGRRDKHSCHHTAAKFSKQAASESRCFHPKTWLPILQLTLHPCPARSHFSWCTILKLRNVWRHFKLPHF